MKTGLQIQRVLQVRLLTWDCLSEVFFEKISLYVSSQERWQMLNFTMDVLQCTSDIADKMPVQKLLERRLQFCIIVIICHLQVSDSTFFSTTACKQFSQFHTGRQQPNWNPWKMNSLCFCRVSSFIHSSGVGIAARQGEISRATNTLFQRLLRSCKLKQLEYFKQNFPIHKLKLPFITDREQSVLHTEWKWGGWKHAPWKRKAAW